MARVSGNSFESLPGKFDVDAGHDLVHCCPRCGDDGECGRHSLKGGYTVVGEREIRVLVDGVGTHDEDEDALGSRRVSQRSL